MAHQNLSEAVRDLERTGQLVRVSHGIRTQLEVAEIQRRLYRRRAPAVLFEHPVGGQFPILANLFGTTDRVRFLFQHDISNVRKLVELKSDGGKALKRVWRYTNLPLLFHRMWPRHQSRGPILKHTTTLSALPQIQSWPLDGGAFITLPAVYTEHPDRRGWMKSNLGMYRVQLGGNDYEPDRECGLHYQIHRGIGVHHAAAVRRGERLPVNVIVGGPPALTLSAVMPLPEGLPELAFAGVLGGRRVGLVTAANGLAMPAEADFVISGFIDPTRTKPEGPFGDHLGYYSLKHDFPVMTVERVYHRPGAIWPFTVVGRPPQEDTSFGEFIHDLTGPAIPAALPGVNAVHAVDEAGVHPLLLAIGSERYVPYAAERKPQELLTLANAILGQGQLSLAKYLLIVAKEDAPDLDVHDIAGFLRHLLERVNWADDLHFQTRTTIDTLDYSAGQGLNAGSKLVIAAAGPKRRTLATEVPSGLTGAAVVVPGVLAVSGPKHDGVPAGAEYEPHFVQLCDRLGERPDRVIGFPLIVLVDSAPFVAQSLANFLWVTFTRSNPAADVLGVNGFSHQKHFGCRGPLVIDARVKPHMAPPLVEDPAVTKRVDELAARGGPLYGLID
ncbi:UbiD family decarboxylase [Limnoglobus roseus]|uniref:UbiD family decarboxylase n=1 Tax=Limnoglobus roseus TaxID=2598579 RepID=A0A5C1ABS1_9BACT|nr:UbiD family decarboxylase [Limnoglobus roseus]QEL15647.1 UbiD family decarboxylase [Limnoglobus roseus]